MQISTVSVAPNHSETPDSDCVAGYLLGEMSQAEMEKREFIIELVIFLMITFASTPFYSLHVVACDTPARLPLKNGSF